MVPLCTCLLLAMVPLLSAVSASSADPEAASPRVVDFTARDLDGHDRSLATWRGRRAVVLVFLGTECPVSNFFAPLVAELARTLPSPDVLLLGVHADPSVTPDAARAHARDYGLELPLVLDSRQQLAAQVGVTVMPSAVVLAPDGRVLYRGRINDQFAPDGRRRLEPRSHDLRAAVDDALAGRLLSLRQTEVFGCPLPPLAR